MIHVNPMLNLMGYHIYEITLEQSDIPHSLITRHRIAAGETIHMINIGEGIFLDKGERMR